MVDPAKLATGQAGASVAGGSIPVPGTDSCSQGSLVTLDIPRVIHRVWLDDPMPVTFTEFGQAWDQVMPDWSRIDWRSSKDLDRLQLPAQEVRLRSKKVIPHDWKRFVADVLRLELLYEYGGLYVDTDVDPYRPMDELLTGKKVLLVRSPNVSKGYYAITNCVMAAVPRHPFIKALIDGLNEAIRSHGHERLSKMVGPWHLDRTYSRGNWPDVTVVDNWDDVTEYITHFWNTARRKRGEGLG
jgi:mannosyltransferase OCH1-like enzyme